MGEAEFEAFIGWLEGSGSSDGRGYLQMHARLVAYFARKRCPAPDELADETLNRAARRFREEGIIRGIEPARYCYILARFVLLEYLRSPERKLTAITADLPQRAAADAGRERALACLDRCLARLDADDRTLIVEYYSGDRSSRMATRRRLAATRGASSNALMIKASRLRARIRDCLSKCLAGQVSGDSISSL